MEHFFKLQYNGISNFKGTQLAYSRISLPQPKDTKPLTPTIFYKREPQVRKIEYLVLYYTEYTGHNIKLDACRNLN